MSLAEDYLSLVIKTVRGQSPVPELQNFTKDRIHLAHEHLQRMKELYPKGQSGNEVLDMILGGDENLLNLIWDKSAPSALTMCGDKSINQLMEALRLIESENIPGDLLEAGVWRGGLPIIMRAYLNSIGNLTRTVWLADSFQGLPEGSSDSSDQAAHLILEPILRLSASRKQVEGAFDYFGLLDSQVKFAEGWFQDSLSKLDPTPLALVRLDGDYYESTKDSIESLYPRLSPGGFLIVDDYNLPLGCKRAIDQYREHFDISEPMIEINSQAVFWRKSL